MGERRPRFPARAAATVADDDDNGGMRRWSSLAERGLRGRDVKARLHDVLTHSFVSFCVSPV